MKKLSSIAMIGFATFALTASVSAENVKPVKKDNRSTTAVVDDEKKPMSLNPGDPAYNFNYVDKDGKMVSMSDLKGKVVLIDVWATWCGPCTAQIPHLKKLEEEMKGKDVAIVSISVDEEKDKEKWLKMIKDENLGGIQLFAGGWGDIGKQYQIKGIPRFMVFDKQGKIVTVNSPRPSSPELKALLEKTLSGK